MKARKAKSEKSLKSDGHSDDAFLRALDRVMEGVFGRSAARAVYYHLEKDFLLMPEDIKEKPEVFVEAIECIFGEDGAEVIENFLAKDLLAKLSGTDQWEEASKFVDWLDKSRNTHSKK